MSLRTPEISYYHHHHWTDRLVLVNLLHFYKEMSTLKYSELPSKKLQTFPFSFTTSLKVYISILWPSPLRFVHYQESVRSHNVWNVIFLTYNDDMMMTTRATIPNHQTKGTWRWRVTYIFLELCIGSRNNNKSGLSSSFPIRWDKQQGFYSWLTSSSLSI